MVEVSRNQFTDFSHLVNILGKQYMSMVNDRESIAYDTEWSTVEPAYALVHIVIAKDPSFANDPLLRDKQLIQDVAYHVNLDYLNWLGYKFSPDGKDIIPLEGDGTEIEFSRDGMPHPKGTGGIQ